MIITSATAEHMMDIVTLTLLNSYMDEDMGVDIDAITRKAGEMFVDYCNEVGITGVDISGDTEEPDEDSFDEAESDFDYFRDEDEDEEDDPYAEYYNYSGYEDEGASEEENAHINDYYALIDFLNKVFGIYVGNAQDIATAIFNNLEKLKNNKNLMIRLDAKEL